MHLERHDGYKKEEKKLKKRAEVSEIYDKIIEHIKQCDDMVDLRTHPISWMYNFEAMRGDLSGYYSFNLCKNGGSVRLIFTVNEEVNTVTLAYISVDHYKDFKKKLSRR